MRTASQSPSAGICEPPLADLLALCEDPAFSILGPSQLPVIVTLFKCPNASLAVTKPFLLAGASVDLTHEVKSCRCDSVEAKGKTDLLVLVK